MYLNRLCYFLLNKWLTNLEEKKIINKVKENINNKLRKYMFWTSIK